MAQRTTVTLTNDLDGGDAAQTLTFAYEGKSYEIDLSDRNAAKLERALQPFISAGRKSSSNVTLLAGRRSSRRGSVASNVDPKAVREWAQANGVEVSARGRVSGAVVEQFKAAGN